MYKPELTQQTLFKAISLPRKLCQKQLKLLYWLNPTDQKTRLNPIILFTFDENIDLCNKIKQLKAVFHKYFNFIK